MSDLELDFKKALRKAYDGWSETYEPRRGSGVGIPDLHVLVGHILVPVEAKVGIIKGMFLFPRTVRPEQISWHDIFQRAGGTSRFAIGVKVSSKWDGYMLENCGRATLSIWQHGWPLSSLTKIMHNSKWVPGTSFLPEAIK